MIINYVECGIGNAMFFEKQNIPILENKYVSDFLNRNNIHPKQNDKLKYIDELDGYNEIKEVFCFENEENFRFIINEIDKTFEKDCIEIQKERLKHNFDLENQYVMNVTRMISLFDDGFREMSKKQYQMINDGIEYLSNFSDMSQQIDALITDGRFILESMPVLKLEKVEIDDFKTFDEFIKNRCSFRLL